MTNVTEALTLLSFLINSLMRFIIHDPFRLRKGEKNTL